MVTPYGWEFDYETIREYEGLVSSSDRNKYPDKGWSGGYYYEFKQ